MAKAQSPVGRSPSRGREIFHSSGRGGAGNIRPVSVARNAVEQDEGARGREPLPTNPQVFSTGRGGAGNIRSPSQEPSVNVLTRTATADTAGTLVKGDVATIEERENERQPRQPVRWSASTFTEGQEASVSYGRGGAGNIYSNAHPNETSQPHSRSRSRGPDMPIGFGRGGAGNMHMPTSTATAPPASSPPPSPTAPTVRAVGRGGAGNIIFTGHEAKAEGERGRETQRAPPAPPPLGMPPQAHVLDHTHNHHHSQAQNGNTYESARRGGAGNINLTGVGAAAVT
ncbi:hypothetical protein H0H81_010372, partial [Sphagnurus paluster]